MSSTFTLNKYLDKPVPGTEVGTWGSVLNASTFNILDNALGGISNISLTSSNYNLSVAQSQNLIINLTGTISADLYVTFPANYSATAAVAGSWIVVNNTLGAFNVTFKTIATGSTGVACPQSSASLIYSDGTNVAFADNRVIGTAAGGGSNQVFYLNDQAVTYDYTIPTSKNAMTAGPISIAGGVTVTINPPTVWTIV
jgi:hypothetical protein